MSQVQEFDSEAHAICPASECPIWLAALSSGIWFLSLCGCCEWVSQSAFCFITLVINKDMLKFMCLGTDLWGALLVTSCQLDFVLLFTICDFSNPTSLHPCYSPVNNFTGWIWWQAAWGLVMIQHLLHSIHRASHFTTEGGQVGGLQSEHGKSTAAVPSDVPALHMFWHSFQEYKLQNLSGNLRQGW